MTTDSQAAVADSRWCRGRGRLVAHAAFEGVLAGVVVGLLMVIVPMAATKDWNGLDIVIFLAVLFGGAIGLAAGLVVGGSLLLVTADSRTQQRMVGGLVAVVICAVLWRSASSGGFDPFGWWALAGIGSAGVIAAWRAPILVEYAAR